MKCINNKDLIVRRHKTKVKRKDNMKLKYFIAGLITFLVLGFLTPHNSVYAEGATFQVSPMNQKISLIPGERTYGTFKVTNPDTNPSNFHFTLSVEPFTVDSDYNIKYENNGDYNQIVDWITIEGNEAELPPNNTATVHFYIDTPENAPAGGQYVAIVVKSAGNDDSKEGLNIKSNFGITHAIFAEVAGETIRKGEVDSINLPSFLFSGNITGTATVKNVGNVHSDAAYTLQVFPIFSDEEIYTNEENPLTNTILPEATRTTMLSWDETPSIGIFHVIYNVEFEGVNQKVDKMVIVCPLWLLFIIAVIIFLIIFKILSGKKEKN